MNSTLRLDAVSLTREQVYLHPVNLVMEPGVIHSVLGPLSSGKTSLIRVLAGLERPSSGRIFLGDKDITALSPQKRSVAMVTQDFINYPNISVRDNILLPLRLKSHLSKKKMAIKLEELAELLGLVPHLNRLPCELSGGQQQRTALARALIKDASILLLDEPLANLDFKLREKLREELLHILHTKKMVMVYGTSDPKEPLAFGGKTICLHEGTMMQHADSYQVYRRPKRVEVARIASDPGINVFRGEARAGKAIRLANHEIAVPDHFQGLADGGYLFGIHPDKLVKSKQPSGLKARVALVEISGSETTTILDVAGAEEMICLESGVHPLPIGKEVSLAFDPNDLYAFDTKGHLIVEGRNGNH